MPPRPARSASVAIVLLAALSQMPRLFAQTARRGGQDTVIFAVEKFDAVQIEPVVIYRRGAFVKPPVEETDAPGQSVENRAQAFVKEYFRPGRRLRLLFGGGESGSVSVVKYIEPGCVGLWAEVKAETQAKLGGNVQALATDSATLGRGPSSRRAPTEQERAEALELARAAYAKNGVGAALVKKMQVTNLTATDLDRDGKSELVGSFLIDTRANSNEPIDEAYALFVIFEPAGDKLKAGMTWFHHGSEAEFAERRFVDQLDIDGDGVGEVIAEGRYYESNDYVIYKRRQGRWQSVYQGGGGGC
ncbi:MAG TPA: hypothetical protein VD968_00570 [Pyrinomonadaceae bacterium]|nr:hypothetical protein [Pyrinomonadaceae bacterium]